MPDVAWYMRRLKAMSMQEVLFRLQRSAATQMERFPALKAPAADPDRKALLHPPLSMPDGNGGPYLARAERFLHSRMDIFSCHDHYLGQPPAWNTDPKTGTSAPLALGKLIDYRDESTVGNIKYLWEPSRHLMLPSLAQAYRYSGDRKYLDCLVQYLDSWLEQCPHPYGVHWCSSLEVGIRLINWSFAWRIIGGTDKWQEAGADDKFLRRWLDSIYRHMQFIDGYYSAYSSANNHLIGEAAGVYVASTTWPAWPDCETFRRRAKKILTTEIVNQTHSDGVNVEQAVAYQQFVLDFFVIGGLAARRKGDPLPKSYWQNVERMLQFIASIMDVNGNVPMIGDADDGFVVDLAPDDGFCNFRSLLATGAVLFDRPDFAIKAGVVDSKTRWLVENADEKFGEVLAERSPPVVRKQEFPEGGYFVLGDDLDSSHEIRIVVDAGPLGMGSLAAHGHADALSFVLSVSGTPILIDPGTYAYHTDKTWRDYFRGTSAHNTVRIDRQDQSEIGGNFMWRSHARTKIDAVQADGEVQFVDATHDGYLRLADPVSHRRKLIFERKHRLLRIEDHLSCKGSHEVEIFFHFPEYVSVSDDANSVIVDAHEQRLRIRTDGRLIARQFHGDDQEPLGWMSYRFDAKKPAYSLRYSGAITGSTTLITTIEIA